MGVILYEMATGMPFDAQDQVVIAARISNPVDRPLAPRHLEASIPPGLEWVIAKSMARDRARRYQTMDEMAEDFSLVKAGKFPILASEDDAQRTFQQVPPVSRPGTPRFHSGADLRAPGAAPRPFLRETQDDPTQIYQRPPAVTTARVRSTTRAILLAIGFLAFVGIGLVWRAHHNPSIPPVQPIRTPPPVQVTVVRPTPVMEAGTLAQAPLDPAPTTPLAVAPDAGVASPADDGRRRRHGHRPRCGHRNQNGLIVPCL